MSDILSQFRDEELPPSTVDNDEAVRLGRRRRRTRTALAAGGAALVLAVAGATLPVLLSAPPGPDPLPGVPTCGEPQPSRSGLATWQRFDPLTNEIDTSGLSGYRATLSATSPRW